MPIEIRLAPDAFCNEFKERLVRNVRREFEAQIEDLVDRDRMVGKTPRAFFCDVYQIANLPATSGIINTPIIAQIAAFQPAPFLHEKHLLTAIISIEQNNRKINTLFSPLPNFSSAMCSRQKKNRRLAL